MISCFFEDGKQAIGGGLRHVTVDMAVLNFERTQILLVKRAATLTIEPGKWVLPGGYLDRGETVIEGAKREVREETGHELAGEPELLGWQDIYNGADSRQNVSFFWLGIAGEQVGAPDHESSQVSWWDLDKLPAPEEWGFTHLRWVQRYLKHQGQTPLPLAMGRPDELVADAHGLMNSPA